MTAPDTAALALLRELEWSAFSYGHGRSCPVCKELERRGHMTKCRLAAVFATPQPAEPAGKPDGVRVDASMVERAWYAVVGREGGTGYAMFCPADLRAALEVALNPAPRTAAGGPTS